ncbi:MAG: DUF1669 domain-containing protein [Anaerolineae bacterium]|nr:DUF1669 domain-containing protein [Anaerolineae bacterium]
MTQNRSSSRRLGWREFLVSLFLIFSVWAGGELVGRELFQSGNPAVERDGRVEVTFTAPGEMGPQLDEVLIAALDGAEKTVDVAIFDLDLDGIAAALIRAMERGVTVRLVTDGDYTDETAVQDLSQAGIPVAADGDDAFMHDKFIVIDGLQVWTGSMNFTYNGVYRNDNNLVRFTSSRLAENYTAEFEEMFGERQFGRGSPAETPHPQVELDGVLVENYFAPEDDIPRRLTPILESAKSEILFLAFTFTDNDLAALLGQKAREGLEVRGVVESRNVSDTGSDFDTLRQSGVDLLQDGNPYIMHHKVIIVDRELVITGSYNFTRSASEFNDENVVIIHSSDIAGAFVQEFQRIYAEAKEPQ